MSRHRRASARARSRARTARSRKCVRECRCAARARSSRRPGCRRLSVARSWEACRRPRPEPNRRARQPAKMRSRSGVRDASEAPRVSPPATARSSANDNAARGRETTAVEVETHYARSGDVNIAYQVTGEGPFDLVFVPGYVTRLELHLKM